MEKRVQTEIQLGHRCNNRCVFCVSGQLTQLGRAPTLDLSKVLLELRAAREAGHSRVTLLGGEPTIQPFFMDVVRAAVELGFEEIVVFSNGSRTGTTDLVERVVATGGTFEWRFSFQGATEEAHERTTRRLGSFQKLLASVAAARALDQRVTVNTCIVSQNYESLGAFGELLSSRGISQLHVDMFHPLDTGEHEEEELRAMIPRYSLLAEPLRAMVRGLPEGFDVHIGNLPFCIAPDLAPWIRHGGQATRTITVDIEGKGELNEGWDKYAHKQRHKLKPESCRECVFDGRCTGVFERYRDFFGLDELAPVSSSRLVELDPTRRLFSLHLRPFVVGALEGWAAPFGLVTLSERGDEELRVRLEDPIEGALDALEVALRRPGSSGVAETDRFALSIVEARGDRARLDEALAALLARFAHAGAAITRSPAKDALAPGVGPVGAGLARLRRAAPFGALRWEGVDLVDEGRRAELRLTSPSGERAVVWLEDRNGRVGGGYRVDPGDPSPALVEGLRAVLAALGRC